MIQAHEWRIFPLLHRRSLFADVENFLLFDFYRPTGGVDENVFAYSNRLGEERGLVIYHNKFADTNGWIKTSAAALDKGSGKLTQRTLAEGLKLPRQGYVIFKDYASQLEYVRSCEELWSKGMYVELGAYQCHAFMDFRFVYEKEWQTIHDELSGTGVQSMQEEWRRRFAVTEEPVAEEKPAKKKRILRKKTSVTKAKAKKPAAKKTPTKTKTTLKPKAVKKETAKKKSAATKAVAKKPVASKSKTVSSKKPVATKKKSVVSSKVPTKADGNNKQVVLKKPASNKETGMKIKNK